MNLFDGGEGEALLYENPTKSGRLVTLTEADIEVIAEAVEASKNNNIETIAIFDTAVLVFKCQCHHTTAFRRNARASTNGITPNKQGAFTQQVQMAHGFWYVVW